MKEKSPLKEYLEVALDAVIAACRVTRYVQRELDRIGQHTKDDQSPVTVADYASQAVIATRMAEVFGTFSLVAEEDADALRAPGSASLRQAVTTAARQAWDDASDASYWTLDPIDGTKGFLRGGQYAVSLALIESGEVVLGILGCPNLSADFERPFDDPDPHGCIFYASAAHGSWTLPADAPGAPPDSLMPQRAREVAQMRICESVEAAHSRLDDTARIVKFLDAADRPMRLDSQCKYSVVARGQADAYLRFSTGRGYVEKIWDHAAGKIVAEEAGVIVTDVDARPLDFSKGAGLTANRGIICAATKFHAPIRGAIEALGL